MPRLRSLFLFVLLLVPAFQVPSVEALTVSPVKLEVSGDPGQTVTGSFELYNEQEQAMTFYVSYANFEAEGESGAPKFVESDEGLASWTKVEEGKEVVTLEKDTLQTINYSVTIPADADAGGYFASIFWGTSPEKDSGEKQLSLGAKVGILLLLTVNGEVDTKGGLLEFDTKDSQQFFTDLPVEFYYRFKNDGADRILPTGTVELYNTLGIRTETLQANAIEGNILPSSIRRFEESWGEVPVVPVEGFFEHVKTQWQHFAFGRYKAVVYLSYDETVPLETSSTTFWVFPWHLLLTLTLGLSFVFFVLRKGLQRYNRYIIAAAMGAKAAPVLAPKKRPVKSKPKKKAS